MKNLHVVLIVLAIVVVAFFIWRPKHQKRNHRPNYVDLLRDDLYFYPPRFPVPRPHLRPHEIPHARHFKKH